MAEQEEKSDFVVLKLDVRKDIKEGLHQKKKENGNRNLADFLRPYFARIVSGEIKI